MSVISTPSQARKLLAHKFTFIPLRSFIYGLDPLPLSLFAQKTAAAAARCVYATVYMSYRAAAIGVMLNCVLIGLRSVW